MSKPAKIIDLGQTREQLQSTQRKIIDDEQERIFLGFLLSGEKELIVRALSLPETSLQKERHRVIYRSMQAIYRVEKSINLPLLHKDLEQTNKLFEVGGIGYLAEISRIDYAYTLLGLTSVMSGLNEQVKRLEVESLMQKLQIGLNAGLPNTQLLAEMEKTFSMIAPKAAHSSAPKTLDLFKHLPNDFWFKSFVLEVADIAQFPTNTTLLTALAAFSAASLRRYVVEYETGGRLATGMYLMGAQPPATGKSRVLGFFIDSAMRLARKAEKDYREELEHEEKAARKPTLKIYSDVTPEALDVLLNDSNGFFSLASSEQALANTLLGASYNTGKNNNDLMLKGFNAEHHASGRAKRGGFFGLVIGGIALLTQPKVIDTLITQSDGTGAAERFLMINEPDLLGMREHKRDRPKQPLGQRDYDLLVEDLLKPVVHYQPDFEDLTSLRLSSDGYDLLSNFIKIIEPELIKTGRYGSDVMRGIAGKADQQVLKIAAQLHLLDTRGQGGNIIKDCWVTSGIGIVQDMLEHAIFLLEKHGHIGLTAQEDEVISYIASKHGKATRREIKQGRKNAKAFKEGAGSAYELIDDTINGLIKTGVLIESTVVGMNGRPSTHIHLAQ